MQKINKFAVGISSTIVFICQFTNPFDDKLSARICPAGQVLSSKCLKVFFNYFSSIIGRAENESGGNMVWNFISTA